jgi:hypothetical protein
MMADYFTKLSIEADLPEPAARWAIALATLAPTTCSQWQT